MKLTKIKEKMEKWHWGILILIFVIALIPRIVGLNWGMPHNNLHPDEGLIFWEAYTHASNHNFEVHQYYRPNHVSIKLNTLLYIAMQEFYFAPRGEEDFALNYTLYFE